MRRLVSLLLAAMLLFTTMSSVLYAEELTVEQKFNVLKDKGIFTGFQDGSARLDEKMSREQFATVLYRLLDLKSETKASATYADVLKTRWSFAYVEAASKAGLMKGVGANKFAPADNVTVEQLAAILVRAFGLTGPSNVFVGGKVSAWAKESVALAVENKLIPPQSDYTAKALRRALVAAVYEVYVKMNPALRQMNIETAHATSNTGLSVRLSEPISSLTLSRLSLRTDYGASVEIKQGTLSGDGRTISLVTGWQETNRKHVLKADSSEYAYVVPSFDSVKPTVTSWRATGYTVEITFSEPMDAGSATNLANYSADNGLAIAQATISNDGRKVTLTTSEQRSGATYTLYVYNVADVAGNAMESTRNLRIEGSVDRSAPTIRNITANASGVVITFNERLDESSAEYVANYWIDGDIGYPSKLTYNDSQKTVTLRVQDQEPGRLYRLTLNHVKDRSGNEIAANTVVTFYGTGTVPNNGSINVVEVKAVDFNTIDIRFNKEIPAAQVPNLRAAITADNGNRVSMSGWSDDVKQMPDRKIVRVQYRKKDNQNPGLFLEGRIYDVEVTGVKDLNTSGGANKKQFAGTPVPNPVPFVTKVEAVNSTSVKVYFSEPVKNMQAKSFKIKSADGSVITVSGDALNNRGTIVTDVVLYLKQQLQAGVVYTMTFGYGVTDAAGFNALRGANQSEPYSVNFIGVGNDNNAAPKMIAAGPLDRHNFEITFSEPVKNADEYVYQLWNITDNVQLQLTKETATFMMSADKTKLIVMLNAEEYTLVSSKWYRFTYMTDRGRITDMQNKPYDATPAAAAQQFAGRDRENARPDIAEVKADGIYITVTFTEEIKGYTNQTNYFEIYVDGEWVKPSSGSISGKTVTLKVSHIRSGEDVELRISDRGVNGIRDWNNQKPIQRWITVEAE